MTRIAILHRREDGSYAAKALYGALGNQYGRRQIFPKFDAVQNGKVLRPQIVQMVAGCDIALVVISDRWLQAGGASSSHKSELTDLVTAGINSAIRSNVPIVAVLIGEAKMPTREQLPGAHEALAKSVPVRIEQGKNFSEEIQKLYDRIEATVPTKVSKLFGWLR